MGSQSPLSILRSPSNGDGDSFIEVQIIVYKAGPGKITFPEYLDHGKTLKAYLDLRCREGGETYTFSWEHRSVVSVSVSGSEEGSGEWQGDYVMYTCRNGNASTFTYQANFLISKHRASHEACPGRKRHYRPLRAVLSFATLPRTSNTDSFIF